VIEEGGSGYQIQRSLRLRASATAYLQRTPITPTNKKKFTLNLWAKRGALTSVQQLFQCGSSSTNTAFIELSNGVGAAGDVINITNYEAGYQVNLISNQVFREPSAHFCLTLNVDTTQAVAADRVKVYTNGVQITSWSTATYPAINIDLLFNAVITSTIGKWWDATRYFDGYLSEVNFIDGQALTPSSFGQTDPVTGQWTAKKYVGTYGTNGFYLPFDDPTSPTTLCYDRSGNSNNWTPNNISTTAGVTYDSMLDVPLGGGGAERGNYCTLNPLNAYGTLYDGNLRMMDTDSGAAVSAVATWVLSTGKWYWEVTRQQANNQGYWGLIRDNVNINGGNVIVSAGNFGYMLDSAGTKWDNGSTTAAWSASFAQGDILCIAFDADTGKVFYGKNGTWLNSADPASGASPASTVTVSSYTPCIRVIGSAGYEHTVLNFGQRPFTYTPPTGFKSLHTGNLPAVTGAALEPKKHFDVVPYTGNGGTQSVTGAQFQPDLVWYKNRTAAASHNLFDSVRGATNALISNDTAAEVTASGVTAFNSNGFTVGALSNGNGSTNAIVSWLWKAGGAAVTNNAGSFATQVSANAAAGFSIVTSDNIPTNAGSFGHGLGVVPKMILMFRRDGADSHFVYHTGMPSPIGSYLALNTTASYATQANGWTAVNSTTFSVGGGFLGTGNDFVFYCFAEIAGYSRIGSYTGNGSADGPMVWCGFRPRYVMIKRSDSVGNWVILDAARDDANVVDNALYPNLSASEGIGSRLIDFTANGFKIRGTDSDQNTSGGTYIFYAISEANFKYALGR
jgi:hypothetical protein